MKLFIIHRFTEKKKAKAILKKISKNNKLNAQLIFLDSSDDSLWKDKALTYIEKAEIIIIFNKSFCEESKNATWEMKKAEQTNKKIIKIDSATDYEGINKLCAACNFEDEFETCLSPSSDNTLELYTIMVNSSENLIKTRQKTNVFFMTVIASLFSVASFLDSNILGQKLNMGLFFLLGLVEIILCYSWHSLIDNYGKLNKAKFDVILYLEKKMALRIFSAEWAALGKGMHSHKYKSFTSTEKNIPIIFICIIIISIIWKLCS